MTIGDVFSAGALVACIAAMILVTLFAVAGAVAAVDAAVMRLKINALRRYRRNRHHVRELKRLRAARRR